jgi:hypothetical protein
MRIVLVMFMRITDETNEVRLLVGLYQWKYGVNTCIISFRKYFRAYTQNLPAFVN